MTKVTRLTLDEQGGLQNRRIHLREISGDLDSPLETVGQDLRAARLRRGDDLASVSRVLKIRRDHLEALEEDRPEVLPGRAYAVGFVRSYAEYLGLDVVQCVERYKAEIAGRSDVMTPVHVIDDEDQRRLPQGWIVIAGVVVVLLIYGAYHLWVSADQMLSQPGTPPPPQTAPKAVIAHTQPTPPPAAMTSPTQASTSAANQALGGASSLQGAAAPPVPGNPASSTATNTQTASLPPAGTPTAGQPQPDPSLSVPLPTGQVYGAQTGNPRVVLRVHEPTRILVQGPRGVMVFNRLLKPGDTYQVPNTAGLTLTTPNGGAVEVDLDGAAMGYAGKKQQITEALSLDPQAIADHYNGGG